MPGRNLTLNQAGAAETFDPLDRLRAFSKVR